MISATSFQNITGHQGRKTPALYHSSSHTKQTSFSTRSRFQSSNSPLRHVVQKVEGDARYSGRINPGLIPGIPRLSSFYFRSGFFFFLSYSSKKSTCCMCIRPLLYKFLLKCSQPCCPVVYDDPLGHLMVL